MIENRRPRGIIGGMSAVKFINIDKKVNSKHKKKTENIGHLPINSENDHQKFVNHMNISPQGKVNQINQMNNTALNYSRNMHQNIANVMNVQNQNTADQIICNQNIRQNTSNDALQQFVINNNQTSMSNYLSQTINNTNQNLISGIVEQSVNNNNQVVVNNMSQQTNNQPSANYMNATQTATNSIFMRGGANQNPLVMTNNNNTMAFQTQQMTSSIIPTHFDSIGQGPATTETIMNLEPTVAAMLSAKNEKEYEKIIFAQNHNDMKDVQDVVANHSFFDHLYSQQSKQESKHNNNINNKNNNYNSFNTHNEVNESHPQNNNIEENQLAMANKETNAEQFTNWSLTPQELTTLNNANLTTYLSTKNTKWSNAESLRLLKAVQIVICRPQIYGEVGNTNILWRHVHDIAQSTRSADALKSQWKKMHTNKQMYGNSIASKQKCQLDHRKMKHSVSTCMKLYKF